MTWQIALQLGRVSNLPTVWTNALAAIVLVGASAGDGRTVLLLIAMSLYYVGGMYLNDAFDADIDAVERPERPIPSGAVARSTVYAAGFGMLGLGVVLVQVAAMMSAADLGIWPLASGLALGAMIVLYNWHHKANPLSPFVMGLCRVLVYTTCGLALGAMIILYNWHHKANPLSPFVMGLCRVLVYTTCGLCFVAVLPGALWIGALVLLCYLIGLTYVAKQENFGRVENLWPLAFLAAPIVYGLAHVGTAPMTLVFVAGLAVWIGYAIRLVQRRQPGDIPRAVVSLIAGISLLDALLIASAGHVMTALVAVIGFALTLFLQRYVSGT